MQATPRAASHQSLVCCRRQTATVAAAAAAAASATSRVTREESLEGRTRSPAADRFPECPEGVVVVTLLSSHAVAAAAVADEVLG